MSKKVVYIAGKITGNAGYKAQFAEAEAAVRAAGFVPLSPANLPPEIDNATAMPICMSMINAADAVLFIAGWGRSLGAQMERAYCKYIGTPAVHSVAELEEVLEWTEW